ncbi:DUF1285 domain-containing protein [Shewanella sp. GXUN23E]|uniref:DUF1285 domain-containing protein n=1 Tax=Shewanella sp. GXUN23E TaxID=3422498 RepID=UPI003D7E0B1B
MKDEQLAANSLSSFRQGAGVGQQAVAGWCEDGRPLFVIDGQGNWYYQHSPLPKKFARLFSSILNCVDGVYQLITPVERVAVEVREYPLLVVDYEAQDSGFWIRTSLETEFVVNKQALTCLDESVLCILPRGLKAKFNRACYYRFINEFVLTDDDGQDTW